ncbi:MAG: DUF6029 family protein [Balneolales bacterium]
MRILFIIPVIILNASSLVAQLSGSNLLESQFGDTPFGDLDNRSVVYNQINLSYRHNDIWIQSRYELFLSPDPDRSYTELTQLRLQYRRDGFTLKVGNLYETLGRGLLLRSYEIPGSLYEDLGYRSRYSFFRDLEGISFEYRADLFDIKFLRGRPLLNILPPDEDKQIRRPDQLEAGQLKFRPYHFIEIGTAYMSTITEDEKQGFGSLQLDIVLPGGVQLYSEYATGLGEEHNPLGFEKSDAFAYYGGLSWFYGAFGASVERKHYNHFRMGISGFNDPPSLVKEHSYALLNRSTHVLETSNETGWQMEGYYQFRSGSRMTLNYTIAKNDLSKSFRYHEWFGEYLHRFSPGRNLKVFGDFARDDLKLETNRITGGIIARHQINHLWGTGIDLQYQQLERLPVHEGIIRNYYTSVSVSYAPALSFSLLYEHANDPNQVDDPRTREIETGFRQWLGFSGSWQYKTNHSFLLFVGKRRGGPSCTSGICYEILDFEGVEIRYTTKF